MPKLASCLQVPDFSECAPSFGTPHADVRLFEGRIDLNNASVGAKSDQLLSFAQLRFAVASLLLGKKTRTTKGINDGVADIVAQALVVGDRRAYLVALLVLDEAGLSKAARTEEEARALLEQAIADVNRAHGPAEHVRRFAVIPRPFSEEESELTPTLKPRRHVCEEHFREEIERFYTRA